MLLPSYFLQCLIHVAEDLAEEFAEDNSTFHYYSSKFSPINGVVDEEHENLNISFYLDMNLGSDSQFYDLLVNSTFSSVHVPTDVLDRGKVLQLFKIYRTNF